MSYNSIMETAVEIARKRYNGGVSPQPGDTVCVIFSGKGNIYTGMNTVRNNGIYTENIHAEIEAISRMRNEGETVIKALTVFDSCTVTPILPCNGCINFIMSLNSENISAEVVTPRGNIFLTNIGIHNPQKSYMNPGAAGTNSVYMNPASQYTGPGVQQGTVFFSAVSSVPGQNGTNQGPVRKSYAAGGAVRNNNLMKNKLSSLFGEDDE